MSVKNGKAFEYASLQSIANALSSKQEVLIEDTPQLKTAHKYYQLCSNELQNKLNMAADAAIRVIVRLEPQLEYPDRNTPLYLSIQADSQGKLGDVRDILCIRRQNEWEIGLSCKHNHRAVKHNRLSATVDFGKEWFSIPCSQEYFDDIIPVFEELREMRDKSNRTIRWRDVEQKSKRFYVPVLSAFMKELKRIDIANPNTIPERLIKYLVGRNDFYKVITNDSKKTTRVEAINIVGTLNRSSEKKRPVVNVSRLKLPTRFYDIDFKANSNTTVVVACDEGWTVSMRIHSAEGLVIPSLKFDVNLISLPNTIHAQVEPW